MKKHNTVLPKDSKEGVLLVLKHGARMTLRDDNSANNFHQITRGGTVRVTTSYADLLKAEHRVHVEHLGFIPVFEEVGKETAYTVDKDVEIANQRANELAEQNSALMAQIEALKNKVEVKPAAVVTEVTTSAAADPTPEFDTDLEEEQEEEQEQEEEPAPAAETAPAPVKATRSRAK